MEVSRSRTTRTPRATRAKKSSLSVSVSSVTAPTRLAVWRERLCAPFVPGLPVWMMVAMIWFGVILSFGYVFGGPHMVTAATYSPPTQNPPSGNIPVTIWNRMDSTARQTNASIDIDGGGPAELSGVPTGKATGLSIGTETLNLGPVASGQNVIFGGAAYDNMNAGDYLMLLQTYRTGAWTDRLKLDRDGNLSASGCFGPVFSGVTTTSFNGLLNGTGIGYYNANAMCAAQYGAGAHVCSSAEFMMSIKCAVAASPIKNVALNGTDGWLQDGPPGYTAPANDCMGWQSNSGTVLGRMWRFNATTGGQGFLTTCNQTIKMACCK